MGKKQHKYGRPHLTYGLIVDLMQSTKQEWERQVRNKVRTPIIPVYVAKRVNVQRKINFFTWGLINGFKYSA